MGGGGGGWGSKTVVTDHLSDNPEALGVVLDCVVGVPMARPV